MTYHILTYGCQMNKNDSERISCLFESSGLKKSSPEEADILVINACSVRKRVVDRILGNIKKWPSKKTTILTGCVLDKDKKMLSQHFDHVLRIENLTFWHQKIDFLKPITDKGSYFEIEAKREKPIAQIPIMTGCNNFCSYCAVPYVRGREKSRPAKDIIAETEKLIQKNFKEFWLLGQNVNSYNQGKKPDFPDLLTKINNLSGDFRISFTSSHPKDFSEKLINKMAECEKVTDYLNLPVQSGDDKILAKMNRPYSADDYKEIINKIRKKIPEISLSTDIIVGFPDEDEKAFLNTKKLLQEIEFDMAYIARYSPRPGTKAAKMEDNVPDKEKKRRASELTKVIKETAIRRNKRFIGKKVRFLPTEYKNGFLIGKDDYYKTVKVKGAKKHLNEFKTVKVVEAASFGLKAELI